MEENKSTTSVINLENINLKMKDFYDKLREKLEKTFNLTADKLDSTADKFHDTAEMLREQDLQICKQHLKNKVKEHPFLSIGIAASLGFILGKMFPRFK